jgi:hypothetical protein
MRCIDHSESRLPRNERNSNLNYTRRHHFSTAHYAHSRLHPVYNCTAAFRYTSQPIPHLGRYSKVTPTTAVNKSPHPSAAQPPHDHTGSAERSNKHSRIINMASETPDAHLSASQASGAELDNETLSPLEQEVLDEYARLLGNLNNVRLAPPPYTTTPSCIFKKKSLLHFTR